MLINVNRVGLLIALIFSNAVNAAPNADDIIKKAIDHWRGTSSYSEITMTIHRPDWERCITMRSWNIYVYRNL